MGSLAPAILRPGSHFTGPLFYWSRHVLLPPGVADSRRVASLGRGAAAGRAGRGIGIARRWWRDVRDRPRWSSGGHDLDQGHMVVRRDLPGAFTHPPVRATGRQ